MDNYLVRGILIGGAIGIMAGWFGMNTFSSVGIGLFAGFFAGLTKYLIERNRDGDGK